jgi:hypothetical protein
MEKEFILYEEALALKKLGFDMPCFFGFDNCSTPMRCTDLRTDEQKFRGVNYNSSTYTSQPTYSQAFRWFRENHSLHAEPVWDNEYVTYWFFSITKIGDVDDAVDLERVKTYEEAELECLKRLIQIVQK